MDCHATTEICVSLWPSAARGYGSFQRKPPISGPQDLSYFIVPRLDCACLGPTLFFCKGDRIPCFLFDLAHHLPYIFWRCIELICNLLHRRSAEIPLQQLPTNGFCPIRILRSPWYAHVFRPFLQRLYALSAAGQIQAAVIKPKRYPINNQSMVMLFHLR